MKIGLDTNVLIYAHVPRFPEHDRVRRWVYRQLESPEIVLVSTPTVLHELIHVITDPRRFEPPVAMSEALALARNWTGRSNVECLPVTEKAARVAFDVMDRNGLGRKRLADSLLAATLLSHDVGILATRNPGDFAVFRDLKTIDPFESPNAAPRS